MKKWTKGHARLIGRIIFADFLEHPLEKYRCIIEEVERSSLFERLAITTMSFSKAQASRKDAVSSGVIAKIARGGDFFSIMYIYEGFNKMYLVDTRKTERLGTEGSFARLEIEEVNSFLHKLRRISSRNELTHRILKGIVKHQERYLSTGDPIDLVPFTQIQLVKLLTTPPDISWVSRLVNRLSVIAPSGEEKPLRWFFQTRKDVHKRLIKQILDKENEDLQSGRLRKPYTDNEIRLLLEDRLRSRVTVTKPVSSKGYGYVTEQRDRNRLPSICRWTVGHCRKDMGIPPANRRLSGYKYPPLSANFSVPYPLTPEEILRNAPSSPGIYEFRLKAKEIEYPNGKTRVIYIGSTRNIKKRLREHLGKNSKNGHIKAFVTEYECLFRYISFSESWAEEELRLCNLFVTTYGAPPECNRVRPSVRLCRRMQK